MNEVVEPIFEHIMMLRRDHVSLFMLNQLNAPTSSLKQVSNAHLEHHASKTFAFHQALRA